MTPDREICNSGINLLREGLDITEVGLSNTGCRKEGFLRNTTSLVQTFGRASRNIDGTVIMYADNITQSMQEAIAETERRRKKQILYNQKHGITPKTIVKAVAKREDDVGINVEIKSMSANDLSKLSIEIRPIEEICKDWTLRRRYNKRPRDEKEKRC